MDKHRELVSLVKSMIGITEEGGDNKGFFVEQFQKAVDGKASGEPWCLSFCAYCIKQIDLIGNNLLMMSTGVGVSKLYPTEHCMTLWRKTPKECRIGAPVEGCLIIWNYEGTDNGHVGIVTEVLGDGYVATVEGNTSDSSGVDREGDGVYTKKRRYLNKTGKMKVVGFLDPWK